ncbi:MAG TPA: hypothetical protein VK388_06275 [Pyrinomonadaceae bacterium]|nr:hypothetical protein [Pyrinomonadaceae bacterium]
MDEKYKIHAVYVLGILFAIIVVLITVQWSEIPNLADRITFALTVTSLILAILAIAYAVYSNTSFSQNISTLNNASKDVSNTARNISEAAITLTQKIEAIPSKLESVEAKVERTNVLLQEYSEKKDEPLPSEKEQRAAVDIMNPFISRMSGTGLIFLYAFSLACTKKKPFDLNALCSILSYPRSAYAAGVYVSTYAAGLIDYETLKDIYTAQSIDEAMIQSISSELESRIRDSDAKEVEKPFLQRKMEEVDKYFE